MTTSASDSVSEPIPDPVPTTHPPTNGDIAPNQASDPVIEVAPPPASAPTISSAPIAESVPVATTQVAAPVAPVTSASPEPAYLPPPEPPKSTRLVSLDALRGFDMFWIIGAEGVVTGIADVFPNKWTAIAAHQMDHSPWIGFRFYDLIFPLFVFIVGVSTVFSLGKI